MTTNKVAESMDWINSISQENFLGIYDIVLDIQKEFEISPKSIVIPLFPTMVKFQILCPMDGINHRDNYCNIRWKAVEYLKDKEIVEKFELIEGMHRWEHRILILINELKFDTVYKKMQNEYKKRFNKNNTISNPESFWDSLHPRVKNVSKKLFEDNHFALSVFEAFKEVNNTVKAIVKQKTGKEYDGADLMNRAFSVANPIITLDDLSANTGRDIQVGYTQIFAGAMTGIRNPKAHDKINIDPTRAIHFLYLSSLLMYKVDESVKGVI